MALAIVLKNLPTRNVQFRLISKSVQLYQTNKQRYMKSISLDFSHFEWTRIF